MERWQSCNASALRLALSVRKRRARRVTAGGVVAEGLEVRRLLTSAALTSLSTATGHVSAQTVFPLKRAQKMPTSSGKLTASKLKHPVAPAPPTVQPFAAGTFTELAHAPPSGGIGTMLLLPDGSIIAALGEQQFAHLTPDANGSYVNGTWSVPAPLPSSGTKLQKSAMQRSTGETTITYGLFTRHCFFQQVKRVARFWP